MRRRSLLALTSRVREPLRIDRAMLAMMSPGAFRLDCRNEDMAVDAVEIRTLPG